MSGGAVGKISHVLLRSHPIESAHILEQCSVEQIATLFEPVPVPVVTSVLSCMAPLQAIGCLALMPAQTRTNVLTTLPPSAASALVRLLEPTERERLLSGLPSNISEPISRGLAYSPDSAGAIADPTIATLYLDQTVGEAIDRLRADATPTASQIFVLDRSQQLAGATTARQLLDSSVGAAIGSLKLGNAVSVHVSVPVVDVASAPAAIVESGDRFVGVITARMLAGASRHKNASSIIDPVAALGELYWVGLREVFGGFSSGVRTEKNDGEARHADR